MSGSRNPESKEITTLTIPVEGQEIEKLIDITSDVLYEKVVERIRQWIIEGHLREGDALPSERELPIYLGSATCR